jgi:hypothetical protein
MLITHSNHAAKVPLRLVGKNGKAINVRSGLKPQSVNDQEPNEKEIERRILAVRSSWDVNERLLRRHAAEERFERLVEHLSSALQ